MLESGVLSCIRISVGMFPFYCMLEVISQISYPYLFLSTAFGWDPARAVAAFLLPPISLLTGILLYLRSMLIKPRLKSVFQKRLWFSFNVCSWITCIGLLGVSAISIYTNIYVHLVFAFALFIAGIMIMVLSTIMDNSLKLPVSFAIKWVRLILTIAAVLSGVTLGVVFVPYPFIGSLMEMFAVGFMTAYFCTFAYKLEKVDSPVFNELSHLERVSDSQISAGGMWLLRQELFTGEKLLVRILVAIYVVLRVIFLTVIYILSGVLHKIQYPGIGVALAYAEDPSRAVAAFILPISAMISVTILWLRARRMRFLLHAPSHWLMWSIIVVMIVVHAIGLFGLGAVTVSTNLSLGYVAAGLWYGGSIGLILLQQVLNWQVSLIQPRYLVLYRKAIAAVVLTAATGIAFTIGWLPAPSAILEMIMSSFTALYSVAYCDKSEFPLRSSCVFAYPPTIPPVPVRSEHAAILIKEVD